MSRGVFGNACSTRMTLMRLPLTVLGVVLTSIVHRDHPSGDGDPKCGCHSPTPKEDPL